mgnify:CR=1 FL=1
MDAWTPDETGMSEEEEAIRLDPEDIAICPECDCEVWPEDRKVCQNCRTVVA